MSERLWYPYAPDQQFGVRAAADADELDHLLADLDARRPAPPRAGNKAPLAGTLAWLPRPASPPQWLPPPGEHPCTTASALDAAPWVRSDG